MAGFTPIRTVVGGDENDSFQPIRAVNLGPAPAKGVVGPALSSGVDQLKQIGYGVIGGASDAVGFDTGRDWANEKARRAGIDAQLNGRPDLENIEDQSLGTALPYATYQILKQAPTIGAIMGAEMIPGVGQAAGAVGLSRLGAMAPRVIGGGGLRTGADFAARRAALAQGEALASEAAMGSAMGFGSLYNESVEGGNPNPYGAMALAPLYGLAEAAVPAAVRGAMRAPTNFTGGLGTRMAKAGGLGALGEAGTETIQNEMEMGMRNDLTPEEIFSRRLNSAVAGGLVGGPLGSLGGIRTRPLKTVDQGSFDLTQPNGGDPLTQTNPMDRFRSMPGFAGNPNDDLMTRIRERAPAPEPSVPETTVPAAAPAPALLDAVDQGLTDIGIPLASGKRTREKQRAFYQAALDSGIPLDSDLLVPYWTLLSQSKYGDPTKVALQNAIVAHRKEQSNVSTPSGVVAGPGVGDVGGSPVVQRGMVDRGPVDLGGADGSGNAVGAGAAAPQALAVPDTRSQQAPVVANEASMGRARAMPGFVGGDSNAALMANMARPEPAPAAAPAAPAAQTQTQTTEPIVQRKKRVVKVGNTVAPNAYVAPSIDTQHKQTSADGYVDDEDAWNDFAPQGSVRYGDLSPGYKSIWAEARQKKKMTADLATSIAEEQQKDMDEGDTSDDVRSTIKQIFGERDASAMEDKFLNNMTDAQIAEKHGLARSRVSQLVGAGKVGRDFRMKAIKAAQDQHGWTDEYAQSLMGKFGVSEDEAVFDENTGEGKTSSGIEEDNSQARDIGRLQDVTGGGSNEGENPGMRVFTPGESGESTGYTDKIQGSTRSLTKGEIDKLNTLRDERDDLERQLDKAQGDEELTTSLQEDLDRVNNKIDELENRGVPPHVLVASFTQQWYELDQKANALMDRIETAREAGLDTLADSNKKKSLDEAVEEYKELRAKAAEAMAAAEKILTKGKPDAVQEQVAGTLDVRQQAGDGQAVGEGNAKPEKPAAASSKAVTTTKPQKVSAGQKLWDGLRKQIPNLVAYESLNATEQGYLDDLAVRTNGKPVINKEMGLQELLKLTDESNVIDVEARVIEETVGKQVAALPDARVERLEKHYGLARDTQEFLAKVKEDVVLFATKGAQAVNAAIRDIIKAIHSGVLSVAMIFNPTFISPPTIVPVQEQVTTTTTQVRAEVPANAQARMSDSAKEVYATLYPAIKDKLVANDKLMVIMDKPNGRMFVFKPDGSLLIDKKVLVGAAKGDYYKGNNNVVANRITPAGLFTMGLRDASRSAAEAKTAGEYDTGKVFVLDKAIDGEYSITMMHSVWLHESDAKQRAAALQNENAADSRYSFGCINVDKNLYASLVKNHLSQMDGAALFVVPDDPKATAEFLKGGAGKDILTRTPFTPKTETTTTRTTAPNATQTSADGQAMGKEQEEGSRFMNVEPMFGQEEKQRTPSLSRGLGLLLRQMGRGELNPDGFANRTEALYDQVQDAKSRRPVQPRVRGADFLRERLLEAKRKGWLSEEAVDLAEWFIKGNEHLLDDLGIGFSGKEAGTSGFYNDMARVMTLIKGSAQSQTTVHEMLHHLERMMPEPVQKAIRKAWAKSLAKAMKAATTPEEKIYYSLLMEGHFGNNRPLAASIPEGAGKAYETILRMSEEQSALGVATDMIKFGQVGYSHYQHVNPSEFWAVNGADLVAGRFGVQGSTIGKLKQWLKEFVAKIKDLFGMQSDAAIIRGLEAVMNGNGKFIQGQRMLADGVTHADIKGGSEKSGSESAIGRVISRAARRYSSAFKRDESGWQARLNKGAAFGPYKDRISFVAKDSEGGHHMFITSQDGVAEMMAYIDRATQRLGKEPSVDDQLDIAAFFSGQHFVYDPNDGAFIAAGPAVDSWAADELRGMNAFSVTDQFWETEKRNPVTRLEGVTNAQLIDALGEFLAFVKTDTGVDKLPVNWSRITGANIGKEGAAFLNVEPPAAGTINKNIGRLPKQAQQPTRLMVNALNRRVRKGLDMIAFTRDLANRAVAAGIDAAKDFQGLIAMRDTRAREIERVVESIADMYAKLPVKDRGAHERSVNEFLLESTRTGKWGYDPQKQGMTADPEMEAWFNELQPESQTFVKEVFKHGDEILRLKKDTVMQFAESEYDAHIKAVQDLINSGSLTPKALADAQEDLQDLKDSKKADLDQFSRLFAMREGKPFSPIMRFGRYAVVAKSQAYIDAVESGDWKEVRKLEQDPDHYSVSFTESDIEADKMAMELQESGDFARAQFFERLEGDGPSDKNMLAALTKLRSQVNMQDRKGSARLRQMVSELYLDELAENSARKGEMRRRGIYGEIDMLRSFTTRGRADAHFIATTQFAPATQDMLQTMHKQAREARDRTRAHEVMREMDARYEQTFDYSSNPWLDKLRRMSSVYFIATSPAYYLQNLTQPWMMSVPAMTDHHDYTKIHAALFKAYGEMSALVKNGFNAQQFDYNLLPTDVRNLIQNLVNQGKIDIGMDTELGQFRVEGHGYFKDKINKVDKALRLAIQKVEAINRLSTAMTAYRLEIANGSSTQDATAYAARILDTTHGDYTSFNAPRAFNSQAGKVALQFRKFQLLQLSFYAKLLKDILSNPAERATAAKVLAYSLGHTAALAGVRGLPGFATVALLASALFGDDDKPYDLEQRMRQMIGDPAMANAIMRGLPTLVGADISGKVGAGNMLSITPFSNADLSTRAGIAEWVGTLVGGASLGMIAREVDGLGLILSGDTLRGLEQMLPKGLGDVIKAGRIANEGMTRRNGEVLLNADEISFWDTTLQALGVQPVKQSVAYEKQTLVRDTDKHYHDRSNAIKQDYIRADRSGDAVGKAKAREAWSKLQDGRASLGYKKQPLSDLLKAPLEMARHERSTTGGVQYNKFNRKFVESLV